MGHQLVSLELCRNWRNGDDPQSERIELYKIIQTENSSLSHQKENCWEIHGVILWVCWWWRSWRLFCLFFSACCFGPETPTINHLQEITGTSGWCLETFVKNNASSRPDTFVVMRSNKVSFMKFESVKYPESHLLEWPLERRHCLNSRQNKNGK